nr:hypothetical protein [uncultured Prevotella sp.]
MNIYEQILAGLKTKFKGVEDATLQRIATNKSEGVTDESKVNSIVEGISFQDVLQSYGDYRAGDAQKTAVQNYEKKYNIKDGKAVEDPKSKEEHTKTNESPKTESQPSLAEQIKAAIAEVVKPLNDQIVSLKAEKEASEWNSKVDGAAKSFGIPEFAYKGKTIDPQTDLNKYFVDLKQEMINSGFQFAKAPQTAEQDQKTETDAIAKQINDGTKEIVSEKKESVEELKK